jgi:hypothetical protein
MRLIALVMAAAFIVASPAHAAWKGFKYAEYGFGVDFPGEPKMSKGEWRGVVAGRVPTTIISAEVDNTTYQVVIADFRNRLIDTPGILEEAIFLEGQEGKIISDTTARTDNGQQFAKYGRRVVVMTKDGGKKISELYLVGGRLLMFEGIISPKGDIGNPEAARFLRMPAMVRAFRRRFAPVRRAQPRNSEIAALTMREKAGLIRPAFFYAAFSPGTSSKCLWWPRFPI